MNQIIIEPYEPFDSNDSESGRRRRRKGFGANLYTIRFIDEEISETDKFIDDYIDDYEEDMAIIAAKMKNIQIRGAKEIYFRAAGSIMDAVMELPEKEQYSKLRLYCLRWTERILILGNGGVKEVRTYQEDDLLYGHVKLLQKLSKLLQERIVVDREIQITEDDKLIGNLEFEIDDIF